MIRGHGDHAANERTFLAWLHTSIAVIAFGFVVEKLTYLL
jgi:inner membrane protein YidH